ncbi:SRPBCC family protein [Psychroflexus montanilacus]|uniref:SRPBCC family protein n=1 Tax=Psychroflexus montanilacus TaxID=2873598 RepID=UPI001CCF75DF|nr:SRPBCC family protein [Psychroflexus montanilacus]MBZ9652981.1 SRPBCC family protein [Psychroflexus montanilacus]
MHIESEKKTVAKSQKETYEFLKNVENFEKLMPEGIEKFEMLSEESFLFQLKGMPAIKLKLDKTEPHHLVVLAAASDKLPFTLRGEIEAIAESQSEVQLIFEGEFNSMMAMMIKNPIKKFITTLSENLTSI